jgi:hypothetical protein
MTDASDLRTVARMPTVHVVVETSIPPERVLEAAVDFSERRADLFPAVSVKRLAVHDLGDMSADVTEGTRAGPIVNWERCRYDWSQPGSVTATVTASNIYALPSSWKIAATAVPGGSSVEMWWIREFRKGPRGRLFGTVFGRAGNRIFSRYARQILKSLERLDRPAEPSAHGPRQASS